MSQTRGEDPGRARNAPNKRAKPSRLDQFAGDMPRTQDEAMLRTLDFRVSTTNPARRQGEDLSEPARSDITYRHEEP